MVKPKDERRKYRRLMVQDSFSMFMVIPEKHGMAKIYVSDLSKGGIGFESDPDSEVKEFEIGQKLKLRLYVNPVFYLTLECKVVRSKKGDIGAEFVADKSKSFKALEKLIEFIDLAAEAGSAA